MGKMTNCKACGKEIAKGVNKCPSCGKDQRIFFMKHKIITGLLILIVLGCIGSANKGTSTDKPVATNSTAKEATTPAKTEKKEVEKPKYEILEQKESDQDGIRYITGKIKNNTGKQISYAQVEINLYDENKQLLGSTLANVNNLEVDGVWNFKAIVTEENYKSYKIMNVTGF